MVRHAEGYRSDVITEEPSGQTPAATDRTTASGGQRAPRLPELAAAAGNVLRSLPGHGAHDATATCGTGRTSRTSWWTGTAPPVDAPDGDRPMPGDDATLLRRSSGRGRTYRRTYTVRITSARLAPEQVVAWLLRDPNEASPTEVSSFEPVPGHGRGPGAEMAVRMPGPWDAPVRVVERTPTSFRFATLRGHMEAGEIEFRAASEGDDLVFTIESWARSGDRLYDALYDKVPLTREMQLHMWVHVCEQVVRMSGGRQDGAVRVLTERWSG